MKRIGFVFLISLLAQGWGYAQNSVNDYKYVIIEKQFHFQTEPNQYDLNRLTKFEFEKLGFSTIMEGQKLPDDLKSNYCLALTSEITAGGFLRTKSKITLKNCNGEIVFVSGEGITKEKDLKRAFGLAIRKAFDTMEEINYKYVPNDEVTSVGNNNQDKVAEDKIEALEAEIELLKKSNEEKENKLSDRKKDRSSKEVSIDSKNRKNNLSAKKKKEEWVCNGEAYSIIPKGKGFIISHQQKENPEFILTKTSTKNIYMFNSEGIKGVALYDAANNIYKLEYVGDGGELVTLKFQKVQ